MHILFLVGLTIAAPAPVIAQVTAPALPAPPGGGPNGQPRATIVAEPLALLIATCDADGDASVSRAELTPCLQRSFASIDTANAGSIGYIGYADWALRWLGDRNALPSPFTIDTNGDDRVTLTELQAQFDTLFARFDTGKDGAVSRAELLTIRTGNPERPPAATPKKKR